MTNRTRRVFTAAVATAAVAALLPMAVGTASAAPALPCGPLGDLKTYDLNDRCDFGSQRDPDELDSTTIAAGLQAAGLFASSVECADGSVAPIIARPDELLVTAPNAGQLNEALGRLRTMLAGEYHSDAPVNGLAALITLQPGALDETFFRAQLPKLQGVNWTADLNYLEPALPNNSFRPADNPRQAPAASSTVGGKGTVLVLDSPAEAWRYAPSPDLVLSSAGPTAPYDVDGNGYMDEDHGHGVFVASLIKRYAPTASVTLYGVRGDQVPGSARWSPMVFSDADLIAAMGSAFGLSTSGTSTRRTFTAVNLSLGGASCQGVAARIGLGRFMRDLASAASVRGGGVVYIAAAGNDGADVAHLPAAFRDKATMEQAANVIDVALGGSPSAEGNAVRKLHGDLAPIVIAVGSWTGGVRDTFSNCGLWVNARAGGAAAISRFPSATGWASWSGTSFATPMVTAALVGGKVPGVAIGNSIGAC